MIQPMALRRARPGNRFTVSQPQRIRRSALASQRTMNRSRLNNLSGPGTTRMPASNSPACLEIATAGSPTVYERTSRQIQIAVKLYFSDMRRFTLFLLLGTAAVAGAADTIPGAPVFPYGAVYFRKSNPPEESWARDHQTAARVGMNTFRHWFMWSAIEVAPGKYDWRDYDMMMDLAAKNGIKVVIAELITAAPEWMFHKYPQARYLASDGTVQNSNIGGSSATGGFPGLCLDNPEVKAAAEKFLIALVEHYRGHPALLGFDL